MWCRTCYNQFKTGLIYFKIFLNLTYTYKMQPNNAEIDFGLVITETPKFHYALTA